MEQESMIYENIPDKFICLKVDRVDDSKIIEVCDFFGLEKVYSITVGGDFKHATIMGLNGVLSDGCWAVVPVDGRIGRPFIISDDQFKSRYRVPND